MAQVSKPIDPKLEVQYQVFTQADVNVNDLVIFSNTTDSGFKRGTFGRAARKIVLENGPNPLTIHLNYLRRIYPQRTSNDLGLGAPNWYQDSWDQQNVNLADPREFEDASVPGLVLASSEVLVLENVNVHNIKFSVLTGNFELTAYS